MNFRVDQALNSRTWLGGQWSLLVQVAGSCRSAGDGFADLTADAIESIANFPGAAIVVALAANGDANGGGIAFTYQPGSSSVALKADGE